MSRGCTTKQCRSKQLRFVEALQAPPRLILTRSPALLRPPPIHVEHLPAAAPAGDLRKFRRVPACRGDHVHSPICPHRYRSCANRPSWLPIGRQRQLRQRQPLYQMPGHGAEERHDVPPHNGSPPGDAMLCYAHTAQRWKTIRSSSSSVRSSFVGRKVDVLGHAVNTGENRIVGHRDDAVAVARVERSTTRGGGIHGPELRAPGPVPQVKPPCGVEALSAIAFSLGGMKHAFRDH